jgi:hypothetical protein
VEPSWGPPGGGPISARDADGSLEIPNGGAPDPVFEALARVALYVHPLLEAKSTEDPYSTGSAVLVEVLRHHADDDFKKLVRTDPALARLAQDGALVSGASAQVLSSTGSGRSVQVELLAWLLIQSAYVRFRLRSRTTSDEFVSEVRDVLSEVRQLLEGHAVGVSALQAFAFVSLPANRCIKAPWGTLRAPSAGEVALGSRFIRGSLSYGDERESLSIQYAGDLVLDSRLDLTTEVSTGPLQFPPSPRSVPSFGEMDRRRLLVSLAVTLAVERERPAVAVPTWAVVLDPFDGGPTVSWRETPTLGVAAPAALTDDDATAVETWLEILEDNYSNQTAMAARRIQSSIVERRDPGDGLVDAVVAWESLFGSREGETTLRVSASIARLLGNDSPQRLALQEETKRIYNVRSRVVHGDATVAATAAYTAWMRASDLGIQVLRRLYGSRRDLLALEPQERSLQLLLGD